MSKSSDQRKILCVEIWEIILHENDHSYSSYRCSYKFAFIHFLSFLTNQKQESGFQQVGGLVTRNISGFCLQRAGLYFKAMLNSIDFYKGIFLNVIPARIIVPCLKQPKNFMRLLTRPTVQNCISQKHGLYRYECKDSRCNLCASSIQECSSFITSKENNCKIRCHINYHSINVLYFLSWNSCDGNTTYTNNIVNFRHRMNNYITGCR